MVKVETVLGGLFDMSNEEESANVVKRLRAKANTCIWYMICDPHNGWGNWVTHYANLISVQHVMRDVCRAIDSDGAEFDWVKGAYHLTRLNIG